MLFDIFSNHSYHNEIKEIIVKIDINFRSNLKIFIDANLKFLLNISSELVRSRICFFLGFYIEEIFTESYDIEKVEMSIEYLFNNIFLYNSKNEGIAYVVKLNIYIGF